MAKTAILKNETTQIPLSYETEVNESGDLVQVTDDQGHPIPKEYCKYNSLVLIVTRQYKDVGGFSKEGMKLDFEIMDIAQEATGNKPMEFQSRHLPRLKKMTAACQWGMRDKEIIEFCEQVEKLEAE